MFCIKHLNNNFPKQGFSDKFLQLQSLPFFGVVPAILDEQGREIEGPGEGYLVSKLCNIKITTFHRK